MFTKRLVVTVDLQTEEKVRLIAFASGVLSTSDAIRGLIEDRFNELAKKPEFRASAEKILRG